MSTYKANPKDSVSVVMIHCRKLHGQPETIGNNQVQEIEQELWRSQACFDGMVVQRGGQVEMAMISEIINV